MKSVGTVSAGTALDVTAPTLRRCCLDSCKDSIFQGRRPALLRTSLTLYPVRLPTNEASTYFANPRLFFLHESTKHLVGGWDFF